MKSYILKIILDIWIKYQRVTYSDFIEHFNKTYPSDDSTHIPKQTFSRILHEFLVIAQYYVGLSEAFLAISVDNLVISLFPE
jgi:hypothetical protein